MVLMRCAMVSTVQCLNSRRMVRWMRASVTLSLAEVASSATSTRGCGGRAGKAGAGKLSTPEGRLVGWQQDS